MWWVQRGRKAEVQEKAACEVGRNGGPQEALQLVKKFQERNTVRATGQLANTRPPVNSKAGS